MYKNKITLLQKQDDQTMDGPIITMGTQPTTRTQSYDWFNKQANLHEDKSVFGFIG